MGRKVGISQEIRDILQAVYHMTKCVTAASIPLKWTKLAFKILQVSMTIQDSFQNNMNDLVLFDIWNLCRSVISLYQVLQ